MAGVMWDLEQKYPGIVYDKLKAYNSKIKTISSLIDAFTNSTDNNKNDLALPRTEVCQIFKAHGFTCT